MADADEVVVGAPEPEPEPEPLEQEQEQEQEQEPREEGGTALEHPQPEPEPEPEPLELSEIQALNAELVEAVWTGNDDQVAKLVRMGANNSAADAAGMPVMRIAARRGHISILASLCRGSATSSTTAAALVDAAEYGHVAAIEAILQRPDVDVNAAVPARGTALVAAACLGHTDCVEYLLAARAEASAPRFQGKTALQWAKELDHLPSVELLTTTNRCDRRKKPQRLD
jgi:hypothetical protein